MIDGFVNIDIIQGCDVRLDLNKDRLPFDDNTVDCVHAHHVLEHLDNYLFALKEIWRVLRHEGRLLVEVPYVTLTEYNLVNPFHKRHFNEYSFDFFEAGKLKGSANENYEVTFKKLWHRFNYVRGFASVPGPLRAWMRRHLFNVVRSISFGMVAVKTAHASVAVDARAQRALQEEFDGCRTGTRMAPWA